MFIRVTAAMAIAALPVLAGDAAPQARELSTDRPDKTESPFTVPAGRWGISFRH